MCPIVRFSSDTFVLQAFASTPAITLRTSCHKAGLVNEQVFLSV